MVLFDTLKKMINNLNTRNKLMISYMFVVFIPVILVGILLTNSLRSISMNNAIGEASRNVDRVSMRMQDTLEIPIIVSLKLYGSAVLHEIVSKEYASQWDIIKTYFDYNEFDDLKGLYNQIDDMRLYVSNNTMIDNWRFVKVDDEISNLEWYKKSISMNGKITWVYMDVPGKLVPTPSLCMIRLLKDSTSRKLGVLVVKMKESELNSILKQESFDTMIVNDKGIIIAAKDDSTVGKDIYDLGLSISSGNEKQSKDFIYKDKLSRLISSQFYSLEREQSFRVISIFTIKDIVANANHASFLGFTIISISLLMCIGMVLMFSKFLTKRIDKVSNDMHRVAMGDFDFVSNIEGNDEAGRLANDLNVMVVSIKKLVQDVYDANLQKNSLLVKQKEIKFKMLANQVNPHFLFNALEAIRMKAVSRDEKEIAQVVKLLGKIMRDNLKASNDLVTVEYELNIVTSYLQIQKFRYGDKVNYKIADIKKELLKCYILPYIIQPVVENAIIHGLENKEGNGNVIVSILDEIKNIRIIVSDDGIGMDEEKLNTLMNSLQELDDTEGNRIGLRNIHQRIRLYYGNEYGISIISRVMQGTMVNILIPKEISDRCLKF